MSYASEVLADSPALYWRLGEATGATTAVDASGNTRDGTYGAGVTLAQTGLLVGDGDTAVALDITTTDYIRSSYNPFATGAGITVEGLATRNGTAAGHTLWGSTNTTLRPFMQVASGSQNVAFRPDSGVGADSTWTAGWPASGAVHWALTFDDVADLAELYINGASLGTKAQTGVFNAAPGNFQAGALGQASVVGNWDGTMDEVAVYGSVLSAARIAAHYAAAAFRFPRPIFNAIPFMR